MQVCSDGAPSALLCLVARDWALQPRGTASVSAVGSRLGGGPDAAWCSTRQAGQGTWKQNASPRPQALTVMEGLCSHFSLLRDKHIQLVSSFCHRTVGTICSELRLSHCTGGLPSVTCSKLVRSEWPARLANEK